LNEGQATRNIRNSLYQNASAFIKCKIQYRQSSGAEKMLEAGFTRYSVVLTGEELPGGRRADAVYIVLHDIYIQVINGAMTRPLDYEYLKCLPPAAQRFYELLSFQMYATIKNDRPRAKLFYSELCKYAPLVRQSDWNVVRPQLARIHAPHRQSGYIASIDFEDTVDADGQPDWVMFYQPGPKARAEFRAFTRRGGPVMLEVEPPPPDPLPRRGDPELSPLETELIGRGITAAIAADLVRDYGEEKIRLQIEILAGFPKKKLDKIDDPAGWLVTAIKNGHAAPKGFTTRAERERQAEAARRTRQAEAEERRRKREEVANDQKEKQAILDHWEALTPERQARLQAVADAQADPEDLAKETGPLKAFGQTIRRHEYIRNLLRDREDTPAEA
jgi:hypothetical protein